MDKKHSCFNFIALLFMPRLSKHERSGAIGVFKADVRVPDIIIAIRQLNSASEIITRLLGQLRSTQVWSAKNGDRRSEATYVDCVSTIFTSTISIPDGCCQCQTNGRAPWVICL